MSAPALLARRVVAMIASVIRAGGYARLAREVLAGKTDPAKALEFIQAGASLASPKVRAVAGRALAAYLRWKRNPGKRQAAQVGQARLFGQEPEAPKRRQGSALLVDQFRMFGKLPEAVPYKGRKNPRGGRRPRRNPGLDEKYRPKTLDQVIGQGAAVRILRALLQGEGPDAFLFTGSSGTGKTTLARIVGKSLAKHDFDYDELNAAAYGDIERVRGLSTDLAQYPHGGAASWRVKVFNEAHRITKAAQEAFLDLLERLPKRTLMIFTTDQPEVFTRAFLRRVKVFKLREPSPAEISAHLVRVAKAEGKPIPAAEARRLAREARGNVGQAMQLLEMRLAGGPAAAPVARREVTAKVKKAPRRPRKAPRRRRKARKGRKGSIPARRLVLLRKGALWALWDSLARKARIFGQRALSRLAERGRGLILAPVTNPGGDLRTLAGKGWTVLGEIHRNPEPAGIQAAARVYRRFAARTPARVQPVDFHRPRALATLGEAVAVVYRSDKWGRRPTQYVHKFGRGTRLFSDETGRGQLLISGRRLRVTSRGIEG